MKHQIDIENWNRKNIFNFYKDLESPFFNITANVDVTEFYKFCKTEKLSYFLANLHRSTQTCNEIENFRYRLNADKTQVNCYDVIHAGSTILFDDQTFGFAYFEMENKLIDFVKKGKKTIEEVKQKKAFTPKETEDLIHYSVIPWVSFTAFKNARSIPITDSIPKIVFGKIFEQDNKKLMPISVEVHHALVDGWHVGQYFEKMASFTEI